MNIIKYVALIVMMTEKLKKHKISYIFSKALVCSIICDKCDSKEEKIFTERMNWDIRKHRFNQKCREVPNRHKITLQDLLKKE